MFKFLLFGIVSSLLFFSSQADEFLRKHKEGRLTKEDIIRIIEKACVEENKSTRISLDKKYNAVIYRRDCGATTGYATHVNLKKQDTKLEENKHGVVKDGEVFLYDDDANVSIQWINNSTLQISCANCLADKVFKKEVVWGNVKIAYSGFNPTKASRAHR